MVLENVFKWVVAAEPGILSKVAKCVETSKEGFEQIKWIFGMEEVGIMVKIVESRIESMSMIIVLQTVNSIGVINTFLIYGTLINTNLYKPLKTVD